MPFETFNDYTTQLKVLIKKNLLLKKKNKCGIFFELFVPIMIIISLFIVLIIIKDFNKGHKVDIIEPLADVLNSTSVILYGPSDSLTPTEISIINILQKNVEIDKKNSIGGGISSGDSLFLPFNDTIEMYKFFYDNYQKTLCGIWFEHGFNSSSSFNISSSNNNSNNINYSIRMDSNDLPPTDQLYNEKLFANKYTSSQFLAVQLAMDQAIIEHFLGINAPQLNASTRRYPNPLDEHWQSWNDGRRGVFLGGSGIFITCAFSVFVYRLTNDLVFEKETKIKEGMKMMGMKDSTYYQSFIISSFLVSFPILLIIFGSFIGSELVYNTNHWTFFFILFFYLITLFLFSIIFSIFFDTSRYSGIISYSITVGLGIAGFFIAKSPMARIGKIFLSLISPIGFANAMYTIVSKDIVDIKNEDNFDISANLTPEEVLVILIVDILFDSLWLWYFDNIWRGEYGTPRPLLFFLKKSYWFPSSVETIDHPPIIENEIVEPVSEDLKQHISISIRNLKRDFVRKGVSKVAVDCINLDLYQNMIHAFLGQNGAGKSTTIGMLSGLIRPSSGDAYIHGLSISNEMTNIRKKLGVCPQHDIVWDQLTVLEHLQIYAGLKGVQRASVESEAINMAKLVGIGDKMFTRAINLSGGEKRKLCLGIAFIGRSEIIMIDEVTSGMDPRSRREVWDFLRAYKQGRTIILTTHYMDEADYLADRIAIISKGKLTCDGSSLFLKKRFGLGYLLTLTKTNLCQTPLVTEFIQHFIPDCFILSDAGTELSYRIAAHAADCFPIFFRALDEQKHLIGIEHYGISLSTLEEVFLQIAHDKVSKKLLGGGSNTNSPIIPIHSSLSSIKTSSNSIQTNINNNPVTTVNGVAVDLLSIRSEQPSYFQQLFGLCVKKYRVSRNDNTAFFLSNLGPWILVALAIICLLLVKDDPFYNGVTTPLTLSMTTYDGKLLIPIETVDGNYALFSQSPISNRIRPINSSIDMNLLLKDEYFLESAGAIEFHAPAAPTSKLFNYTIFYNTGYPHISPAVMNYIHSNLLLQLSNTTITTNTVPFEHVATSFEELFYGANVNSSAYFLLLSMAAYSFMIASFGAFMCVERESHLKSIIYISGCSKLIYWIANLLWDSVISIEIGLGIIGAFAGVDSNLRHNIGLIILAQSLYCLASIPLSFLISYNYTTIGKAFGAIFGIFYVKPILMMAFNLWFRVFVYSQYISTGRNLYGLVIAVNCVFYLSSPLFCFGHILMFVLDFPTSNPVGLNYTPSIWSMLKSGTPLLFLAFHFIVWTTFILLIDYKLEFKGLFKLRWKQKPTSSPEPPSYEDPDVSIERKRVEHLLESNNDLKDTVVLKELHKTYPAKHREQERIAVYNTSLAINKGETFGLLGLSGAGKTTTLSMLTGDIEPSAGKALINGFDLITQRSQALSSVGVCIQGDSLIPLITGREHLRFFSRMKGIPKEKIKDAIESFILAMDMADIIDDLVHTYSGGNRRKLSLCLALLGNPSVLFIDEASSGCDPQARRLMWNLISQLGKSKAIILTTHSMEECEALCQRVSIMKCGRLMCIGSNQHIKSRFCSGYSLDVKFKGITIEQGIQQVISALPTAQLLDSHDLIANFEIPDGHLQVWQIFQVVQQLSSTIEDYSVSQTSIEQVFIKLTSDYYESHYLIYANQPNVVYTEFYPPNFYQTEIITDQLTNTTLQPTDTPIYQENINERLEPNEIELQEFPTIVTDQIDQKQI